MQKHVLSHVPRKKNNQTTHRKRSKQYLILYIILEPWKVNKHSEIKGKKQTSIKRNRHKMLRAPIHDSWKVIEGAEPDECWV